MKNNGIKTYRIISIKLVVSMKRIAVFIIFCCVFNYALAEFVNLKIKDNIPVEDAISHFANWFQTSGCSFELFSDETDEINMRHQAYQQFYNGIAVENCIIIVHSKDGKITYVNGDIMRINSKPSNPLKISKGKAKKLAKSRSASDENVELTIIHVQTEDGDVFYNAYKVVSENEDIYIDVQTGEVLKRISRINNSTVCKGTTKYSGERSFDAKFNESSENYIARDDVRNINVGYAKMDFNNNTYSDPNFFSNPTTDWNNKYLTSVTIESVNNKWWSKLFDSETYPNLYIKIIDDNDNVLYRSDYKDMSRTNYNQYPVSFNIGKMIKIPFYGGYKIKIYDQDAISDDLGLTVTISNNELGTHTWGQSSSNVKGSFVISQWHPAIDVMWGLQQVYDYYLNVFNRHSFDDENAKLKAIIHNPTTGSLTEDIVVNSNGASDPYENAFALNPLNKATAYLHFGLGKLGGYPWVEFNIIGHEYTHQICAYRSLGKLEYKGESGALNESLADIMAKNIEYYHKPLTFTWQLNNGYQGESTCLRDFQNPDKKNQPSCYDEGRFWIDPSSNRDHGGVHTNSGVSNHWYYLLCEGGEGINDKGYEYNVSGISIEKAQYIVFRTLLNYLPPQATFLQARNLSIQAAEDLYGENSDEVIAVDNAWKAVGVGDMKNILKPGKYWIFTNRTKNEDKIWFMSSDLGSAKTKRFQADTLEDKFEYFMYDADEKFLWDIEKNEDGTYTIKNGNKYISWTSGNSAILSETPFNLSIVNDLATWSYTISFTENSSNRYLSLNQTEGNNFFAFYANTSQQCNLYFAEYYPYDTITIKAKIPSNWQDDIHVVAWRGDKDEKKIFTPTYNDGWYTFSMVGEYYVCFVNGTDTTQQKNMSEVIEVLGDCCVKINAEVNNKYSFNYISCDEVETPEEEISLEYYIVAKRETGNYYFLTPNKVSGKDRLVAVDAGTSMRSKIDTIKTTADYLWSFEEGESGYFLRNNNGQYLTCSAAKSASMSSIGMIFNIEGNNDGTITISYPTDDSKTHYLSLANAGSDYFVFYANANQVTHLLMLPKGKDITTSMTNVENLPHTQKILRDGQIFILRGDKVYSVTGQEVK